MKSGDEARLRITYAIVAPDEATARARALAVALEQTVEIPADIVPAGFIAEEVVGRIESLTPEGGNRWSAVLSYRAECAGAELPQWLNLVFGNSSMLRGLQVTGIGFDPLTLRSFPGPRYGVAGIRARLQRPTGPLICSVIKPMGRDVGELAQLAYQMALGGADIIKDDHGIANQRFAPYDERVPRCIEAVERANRETGNTAVFAPNVTAPFERIESRALLAAKYGAGALMVLPGLVGFDVMRWLSQHERIRLPILSHPAMLGAHVAAADGGFTHALIFGTLPRLAGADVSIFPNIGGRFSFSAAECSEIGAACLDRSIPQAPIFPSPGGGMTLERVPDMRRMYGDEVLYLFGGSLLRFGADMPAAIHALRDSLNTPAAS
jgi:ribulose-bisphosphate carboxylase large chain